MQPQLGIWKRFIRSLSEVDRCILSWGSGIGLLEVYQGWTDANSAGDLEEVYYRFISGRQMQPQLGIWKRLIRSLLQWRTDAASAGDVEEFYQKFIQGLTGASSAGDLDQVDQKFIGGGQMQSQLGIWKRFIYQWRTELAEAGDWEEVYSKLISWVRIS